MFGIIVLVIIIVVVAINAIVSHHDVPPQVLLVQVCLAPAHVLKLHLDVHPSK